MDLRAGWGRRLWLPVIVFAMVGFTAFTVRGFQFASGEMSVRAGMILVGTAAAFVLDRRFPDQRIGRAIDSVFQIILIGLAGLMLSYAAASLGQPLADAGLLRIDQSLGYHWQAYGGWYVLHPRVAAFVLTTYEAILVQPLVLALILAVAGHHRRLDAMLIATMTALLMTIALFAFFPATTAWTHLGVSDDAIRQFGNLPLARGEWIGDLLEIREGGGRSVLIDRAAGLIAFPSFHCISALICARAVWPMRRLRLIVLPLNVAMIAATPVRGGHYLIDLIGGAAVAGIAILLSDIVFRRRRDSR